MQLFSMFVNVIMLFQVNWVPKSIWVPSHNFRVLVSTETSHLTFLTMWNNKMCLFRVIRTTWYILWCSSRGCHFSRMTLPQKGSHKGEILSVSLTSYTINGVKVQWGQVRTMTTLCIVIVLLHVSPLPLSEPISLIEGVPTKHKRQWARTENQRGVLHCCFLSQFLVPLLSSLQHYIVIFFIPFFFTTDYVCVWGLKCSALACYY